MLLWCMLVFGLALLVTFVIVVVGLGRVGSGGVGSGCWVGVVLICVVLLY